MLSIAGPDCSGLSARDAAFAHAICDAVTRRWITLEHIVRLFLRQPFEGLEPSLRAVLLGGVAQVYLLDRVPVHAAIDTAVQWAKTCIRSGAGSIVNAVLRRASELLGDRSKPLKTWSFARNAVPRHDGTAIPLVRDVLPSEPLERMSIATSHPLWLLQRWSVRFGEEKTHALALHGLCDPPIVLNTAHVCDRSILQSAGLAPHSNIGFHLAPTDRDTLSALLTRGDLWVQDPASTKAVSLVAHLSPRLIIDLCAGRGTKTRQLAALFPGASIIASDPDPQRSRDLAMLARSIPRIRVVDPRELSVTCGSRADLVLADVPCSNTGVLPRRAEARYRCDQAQLNRLTILQRQILDHAGSLLAPGGQVLYSTCSVEHEENEDLVESMRASKGQGMALDPIRIERTMPSGLPGVSPDLYHDGGFAALLARSG